MSFREEQNKRTEEIEHILRAFLPKEEGFQKTVTEAMNYSMLAGGKRLRPMLMQETYRLFGGNDTVIEPFMAAIEMIHTYSLVHDDLPAMDNDAYRRGRETTHIRFGHAMGILAGDAIVKSGREKDAGQLWRVLGAQRILAEKAGIYGMVGGQTVDVEATEKKEALSREKLDFIYRLKTSALIEGAMMAGAVLAGASEKEVKTIERIAGKIGLAFQIQDDILDVTGTPEALGKPIHSDERNEKITYVTLEGLERSAAYVDRITGEALGELKELERERKAENPFLKELLIWLTEREK